MALIITHRSHLDHSLTIDHVRFLLAHSCARDGFFIASLTMPTELPALPCALRGPIVGNPAIADEDTIMRARNGRAWPSRMLADARKPMRTRMAPDGPEGPVWGWSATHRSRVLTAIGGPSDGHPCVLYTAYGGPLAPREPGDPSLVGADLDEAIAFWSQHALVGE